MAEDDFWERIKIKANQKKDTRTKEDVLKCIKEEQRDKYVRLIIGQNVKEEYTVCIEEIENIKAEIKKYYRVIARGAKCVVKGENVFLDEDAAYRYALYKLKYLEDIKKETYMER